MGWTCARMNRPRHACDVLAGAQARPGYGRASAQRRQDGA